VALGVGLEVAPSTQSMRLVGDLNLGTDRLRRTRISAPSCSQVGLDVVGVARGSATHLVR
jgi:hypothetical protein